MVKMALFGESKRMDRKGRLSPPAVFPVIHASSALIHGTDRKSEGEVTEGCRLVNIFCLSMSHQFLRAGSKLCRIE